MKTNPAVVAAVYDRRFQTIPALIERRYRAQPAPAKKTNHSVVAAVCDRRFQTISTLIERRYRATATETAE
jgi:AMMECR1 domain-containing protein